MNGARRVRASVSGCVQGVGFRPFVHRLATESGISGWVCNGAEGVLLEAEGPPDTIADFLRRLAQDAPGAARIDAVEAGDTAPEGASGFVIRPSVPGAAGTLPLPPDIAPCADCLRELFDPADRRHRYPFLSCARCGPRWSVAERLPWDRENTTLCAFALCTDCRREFDDPTDRRFHAQTIACPACGPRLTWWNGDGAPEAQDDDALQAAATALRAGQIVAVQGIGGFHLMADARNDDAVRRLRVRKRRPDRPFALMFADRAALEAACHVDAAGRHTLESSAAPIVLLPRRTPSPIAAAVAPGLPWLGAMLPPSPLHHLIARDLGVPLVATSGNVSGEPLCTDPREASVRLRGIADAFLVHDRPIAAPTDDSVLRVIDGTATVLRCARGIAPLRVRLGAPVAPTIAWGGHLKAAVAVAFGDTALLGPHVGDLETVAAVAGLQRGAARLAALSGAVPVAAACDTHPDYGSTALAERSGLPLTRIAHHAAHAFACLAENGERRAALAVAWDGAGDGGDGTVWGGEFLRIGEDAEVVRIGCLRPFPLPGGDRAAREPRRSAVGVLAALFGAEAALALDDLAPVASFSLPERTLLRQALERGVNTPTTTSAGRLFDAAAALLGLVQTTSYEGQAALALEAVAAESQAYPLPWRPGAPGMLDWEPLVRGMLEDIRAGRPVAQIAGAFHGALARGIVAVALRVEEPRVCLTGGCFQNARLAQTAARGLRDAGFIPLLHQRVPAGDGGLALGQAEAAARRREAV